MGTGAGVSGDVEANVGLCGGIEVPVALAEDVDAGVLHPANKFSSKPIQMIMFLFFIYFFYPSSHTPSKNLRKE